MSSARKKLCLICSTHLDDKILVQSEKSKKLLKTCYTYLQEAIVRKSSFKVKQDNQSQFCRICFDFASELTHLEEELEKFRKKISNVTLIFSLSVLHKKSQIDSKNDNSKGSNKNIIEVDISDLPGIDIYPFLSKRFKNTLLESSKTSDTSKDSIEEIKVEEDEGTIENSSVCSEEDFSTLHGENEDYNMSDKDETEFDTHPPAKSKIITLPATISFGSDADGGSKKDQKTSSNAVNNIMSKLPVVKLHKMKMRQVTESNITLDTSRNKSPRTSENLSDENEYEILSGENESETSEDESSPQYFKKQGKSKIHQKGLRCKFCANVCLTKEELKIHSESHKTKGEKLKCLECDKTLKTSTLLRLHMRIHTGEKRYKCSICNRAFTASSTRNRHQLTHSEDRKLKQFKCELCPKAFITERSWKTHARFHTGDMFQCSICGKRFTEKKELNCHEKIHTGVKPHQCQYCEKAFIERYQMVRHERSHTGEKPFKCTCCDKTFSSSASKIVHERSHTGEKPYKCEFCDKAFYSSNDRSKHQNVHTKAKFYTCSICNKTLTTAHSLKDHQLIHSGEKPFKCEFCFKEFVNRKNMVMHQKRVHETIVETTE